MDTDVLLDELAQGTSEMTRARPVEQLSFEQFVAPRGNSNHAGFESQSTPLVRKKAIDFAPPVSGRHQDLRLYLTVLLKTYTEMLDAGLVREAPYRVHMPEGGTIEPDILYISNANFDRVHDIFVEGPPDIVIEISSLDTTAMDRGEKFVIYEELGVREYWMLDIEREMVGFYHLGPNGHYTEFRPDMAGRYNSRVLKGFVLEVDRLWKRVLPRTQEIVELAQAMIHPR
jgi:Uma2 family endonuclease